MNDKNEIMESLLDEIDYINRDQTEIPDIDDVPEDLEDNDDDIDPEDDGTIMANDDYYYGNNSHSDSGSDDSDDSDDADSDGFDPSYDEMEEYYDDQYDEPFRPGKSRSRSADEEVEEYTKKYGGIIDIPDDVDFDSTDDEDNHGKKPKH
jgi:hypothetical protein